MKAVNTMEKIQKNQKYLQALFCAIVSAAMLTGCAQPADSLTDSQTVETTAAASQEETTETAEEKAVTNVSNLSNIAVPYTTDISSLFSDRDKSGEYTVDTDISLNGTGAEISGSGAAADGSTVTITEEGTYHITGSLTGQIVVASEGKVQLVLDNAEITNPSGAAIYVTSAKKVFVTLADGSQNALSDGSTRAEAQEDTAALYSKDSLTINGSGSLTVTGNYDEGIVSKDDVVITGGTLSVTSAGHGIKGKDYVAVCGGTISVDAGGDGIKATNTTDAGMGFVYISGGTITIDAAQDGIQAESELIAEGGTLDITAGGGTVNAPQHSNDFGMGGGMMGGRGFGRQNWNSDSQMPQEANGEFQPTMNIVTAENTEMPEDAESSEDSTPSIKGMKAGSLLYIGGGEITVNAADDALHSNGSLYIAGGSSSLAAGSKGIHADETAEISGGSVEVTESYEGIEAKDINVSDGTVRIKSSDDGFNASDGSSEGAMGGAVACTLTISGGYVYVDAGGDGLDSNGDLLVSGGIVLVNGPTDSGNGALDSNSSLQCTGGLLIAAGASGMAEYPDGTQNTIVMTTTASQQGGTLVTVLDADGNEILSFAPAKSWNSFIVSSSLFEDDASYTFLIGGTSDAQQQDGLYEPGGYQNDGTEEGSVTVSDAVSYIGTAGGMGGGMGHGGFNRGQMPEGDFEPGQMPEGDFQPGQMPEGDFQPGQMPEGEFQPGQMPEGDFQPGDMQPPTDENGAIVQRGGGMRGGRGGMQQERFVTDQEPEFS